MPDRSLEELESGKDFLWHAARPDDPINAPYRTPADVYGGHDYLETHHTVAFADKYCIVKLVINTHGHQSSATTSGSSQI
jgi:hypothetical protein